MPGTDVSEAALICENIYRLCNDYKISSKSTLPSISLGYAAKETAGKSLRKVLKSAEDFMYKRKLLESRSTHSSIIASMKKTLYEKSHETEAHTSRLRDLCMKVASTLKLNESERNDLELFSVLHDIGKITIDDRILNKKGPLNEEEWAEMRKHPETGCRIALSAVELVHISEYILTHHERWDGTGYPQGLKAKEIPLLSRILSIVDAYDAMTQDRIYRKAMPIKDAVGEIKAASGSQFDPEIAEIFLKIIIGE
jgi:HD-GYP domain-containing protein (c-di-GMP phosphodiesterase class II)